MAGMNKNDCTSDLSLRLELGGAQAETLAGLFKALANPVRLQILDVLIRHGGQVCVCDIEALFDLAQATISHHLKVLREAGVVEAQTRGQWSYYRVAAGVLSPARYLITMLIEERPIMTTEKNVLFLCTGNSARSIMAEALLRKHAGDRFKVYSAGLEPKGVNPYTVRAMREIGVDVSDYLSENVKDYMGRMPYRYVITVCSHADAACPTPLWALGDKLHWPFDDPAAAQGSDDEKLAEFRRVRDQIDQQVQAWLATNPY